MINDFISHLQFLNMLFQMINIVNFKKAESKKMADVKRLFKLLADFITFFKKDYNYFPNKNASTFYS